MTDTNKMVKNQLAQDRKYEVFISYNLDKDKILAKTVKDKLTILGRDRLNINFCELIPGGKDWREWIVENIQKSSIFIFLYTTKDCDWNWCIHEAGIFRGSKKKGEGYLICIKNRKLDHLAPIKDLEGYISTENSIRQFLEDLLYNGNFTSGDRINEELFTIYKDSFHSAYKDISEQFASTPLRVDYLPKRLKIGPIKRPKNGTPSLEGTPIRGNKETMDLFELDCCSELIWEDVYQRFHQKQGISWVDDIVLSIKMIKKRQKPRRLLHGFYSADKIKYYPVLSRIDRIDNDPIYLYVIFIGKRDFEDKNDVSITESEEPEIHKFLNNLIGAARYFRWNIIEAALSELKSIGDIEENEELVFGRIKNSFAEIEQFGKNEGMRLCEVTKQYFPVENHNKIEKFYGNYWLYKIELMKFFEEKNIDKIIEILENWRFDNKDFTLMSLNRYIELIENLKPL